jgi:four helix bundle protein
MDELISITKRFAIEIVRFVESFDRSLTQSVVAKQLLRSGTSVGANYRAAMRAKSTPDFISKMGTVEEEADESLYWMELLAETENINPEKTEHLRKEANRILGMTVNSIKTARSRLSS